MASHTGAHADELLSNRVLASIARKKAVAFFPLCKERSKEIDSPGAFFSGQSGISFLRKFTLSMDFAIILVHALLFLPHSLNACGYCFEILFHGSQLVK